MPTREERIATEARIRAMLATGPEATLRAIPGVTHVSVGLKERGQLLSRDVCIRVYVDEKKPLDKLAPAERIPSEIEGIPTDVIVPGIPRYHLDVSKYRPVEGGILITNRIIGVNKDKTDTGMAGGTFGCTATTSDGSPVLLSCCHVLMANGAKKGDYIYQPGPVTWDPVAVEDAPVRPHDDVDQIGKILDWKMTPKVDAAIARLDISSCCHCCGIEKTDEILGLSKDGVPASDKIVGLRAAVYDSVVFKVGATSQRSIGRIADTAGKPFTIGFNGVDTTYTDQIYISGEEPPFTFSYEGDSGSAIIDEDGYIVGLLFAGDDDPPPAFRAYANHIEDVQSALHITINITKTTHSSGARVAPPEVVYPEVRDGRATYTAARTRLTSDPAGAWLWKIAEEFREEIVRLVTTHRPVTVAWRRAGGPAFFAAGLNAINAGVDVLPDPVNGISFEDALERMGNALSAHGSPELRAAIAEHRTTILGAAHESVTLRDVLEKLRPAVARA